MTSFARQFGFSRVSLIYFFLPFLGLVKRKEGTKMFHVKHLGLEGR